MTSSYTFKPLGPAPIQDPFVARLNRADPWGSGKATGAVNTLEMIQDRDTKDGTLYAGSVNGGVWARNYNGATDSWDEKWKWHSSSSDYKGVQSISKLKVTKDKKWLIAAAGAVSSLGRLRGDIQEPLQLAVLNSDGSFKTWRPNVKENQNLIKGKAVTALETNDNVVIIGTDTGLYVGEIDGDLKKINATNLVLNIDSIAIGPSGRIYAAVRPTSGTNEGKDGTIYTTTISDLKQNPLSAWKVVEGSEAKSKNKAILKLSTTKDPISGKDVLYLGTAAPAPSGGIYDYIYRVVYNEQSESQVWAAKEVKGKIGTDQADLHSSFAADPTDPNRVFAGGNWYAAYKDTANGGLVAIKFDGINATLENHFPSPAPGQSTNAAGTAPHADSRDIIFLTTKTNSTRIIEADDGGIAIKDIELTAPWKFNLNEGGLRTTESFASDWSNVGNLAITAMQDNALSITQYKSTPTWFNVTGGDGAIARFDDAQKDNFKGYAHAYYGSQSYSANGILETAAYDKTGTLKYKDLLELDVLDKFRNFEDFLNYDMIYTGFVPKDGGSYPFYLPFETNNYRAGDIVLAGQRNIYEQIVPHWTLPTAGQMKLVPLIKDDIKRIPKKTPEGSTIWSPLKRIFTALEIGSKKGESMPKSKPYSWDALYTSFLEQNETGLPTTKLYGRKADVAVEEPGAGIDVAKNFMLENLTSYLPIETIGNTITGLSFNPNNSDQLWATIAKTHAIYGLWAELKRENFEHKSYLIYSNNGGKSWETLTVSGLNGIPSNAQLQQVQYVPVKDGKPAELYLGGYGGVWYATIENNGKPGTFKSVKWDGLEKGIGWDSPPSGTQDPNFSIWNTDLEYDPVDDVIVASTMGQGTWLLNRSELEASPADIPGIKISPIILPQDLIFLKRKRGTRQIEGVMTVSLERTNENINKNISVDLKLDNGWEKYLNIINTNEPQFKLLENKDSITLNFAPGINQLSFDVNTKIEGITLPDLNIKVKLENPVNTVIASDSEAYVYLYANGETITMNQEEIGVFYSNKTSAEIRSGSPSQAQQLAVLMPRSNLNVGDQLFWLPVNSDGSINNPNNDPNNDPNNLTLKPDNPRYLEVVNNLINNPSRHIATSTQSFDSRAFSPEKAAQAFRNPSAVLSSEGISIGDLSTSTTVQDADRFALALKDQKGNVRVSTQGFGLDQNPQLDNTINIGASGPGSQVVLAPAEGELFVADDSYFISNNASPTDRIEYNLGVARFGNYNSGYGIFRVDNPLGQFADFNKGSFIMPGSVEYAKEAFKRSKSNGLDGITGLPIPGFGQSANHSITLATGNYYGMYITPNKVFESENSLSDLSQILFSIRTANLTSQLQHVSMGTGYFAFEDMGFAGDRDFNDMLFAITPKSQSIIG
ncbi:DUF4114 domain-containing protein [Synechococcus lacustris]|uniref:DUF4114 domain-containing protein n=2 Tax=Synechococcus lacustris TaxID=2116544 RepID=UPI0020CC47D2|nr:DUF4114 domain-containing protein [Synechococcus lacustris]MCP9813639.1 DUF4114 domain-containing protein [Synechococcus lacustris L1E-Slac]